MAETEKRGRGRPKKETPVVENENTEKVSMTKGKATTPKASNDLSPGEKLREIKEGVGKVVDARGTKTVASNSGDIDVISLQSVQNRWQQIFSKYSGIVGFETMSDLWKRHNIMGRNPFSQNRRIKQLNTQAQDLDKADLKESLQHPETHEYELRGFSMYLYYTNYIYQTLLQLNRNTPKYFWYANPIYVKTDDKESILQDSQRVDKALKSFNPSVRFKTIANQVSIEGKCSYLVRLSYNKNKVNYFLLQKLNSDMVKLTGIGSKQQFEASFNMAIFLEPSYDVRMYPKFIRDAWEDMINNNIIIKDEKTNTNKINIVAKIPKDHILESTGGLNNRYMYWVKLPQDLCYTFYSDGSHPNAFPDTIGLFNDLNDLDDYRWLQGSLLSRGVNSILTAQVPMVKDPKPGTDSTAISPDTILGYQDLFMSTISANIFPFFAPFTNFELHGLENQPEAIDIIYSRIRDLIATSGNSALLPITDKPSIASVKAAESIQASKNEYLTKQFEQFLNNVLNESFELKHVWKVNLWGDIFYWRDDMKNTKELVISGVEGLLPRLLSAQEETLEDYKGATIYLKALGIKIEKPETKNAQNNNGTKNPVGRPKLDDTDIENDNTGTSNDLGNNVSEIKYSLNNQQSLMGESVAEVKDNDEVSRVVSSEKPLLGQFAAHHDLIRTYSINEDEEDSN